MARLRAIATLLLVGLAPLAAQSPASTALTRLTTYLDGVVARGEAVGIVAEVRQHGRVVYRHATGMADREAGRAMDARSLFRIASQTKAITTAAAMTLVEEGRLALGDPISRYLPAFASARVAERFDSAGQMRMRTVPAARAITVRDLMTHTAGMSYGRESWLQDAYAARGLGPEAGHGWYFAHKTTDICTAVMPLADLPLAAQPGERFVYGYATDVLGCLLETITGQSLARVIADRITGPLGMADTRFCLDAEQGRRLAAVYALQGGTLTRAVEGPLGQGDYVDGPCRAFAGGAGLISTASDYATFLEMIRRGGTLDGHRVLSPASTRLMTHDQLGTTYEADGVSGFGLGFQVWHLPALSGRYGEAGQYGWGGAYHTNYWVDPAYGLVAVVMTQLLPANGSTLPDRYRTLVYQMLDAPTHDGPPPE
jgi:CubicO group peptidase (beta-lactamase class C family)